MSMIRTDISEINQTLEGGYILLPCTGEANTSREVVNMSRNAKVTRGFSFSQLHDSYSVLHARKGRKSRNTSGTRVVQSQPKVSTRLVKSLECSGIQLTIPDTFCSFILSVLYTISQTMRHLDKLNTSMSLLNLLIYFGNLVRKYRILMQNFSLSEAFT